MPTERCPWCGTDPLYVAYHDQEWGVPQRDPLVLFEMLVLEGFQAGLSWLTILKRRQDFRRVFDGFDPLRLAAWTSADIDRAVADPGIIRHRGKVEATVLNARNYLKIEEKTGFATFLWDHVGGVPMLNAPATMADVPAQTPESQALSRSLRGQGFRFCGPVIAYAFMQATGMVNDHLTCCPRRAAVQSAIS